MFASKIKILSHLSLLFASFFKAMSDYDRCRWKTFSAKDTYPFLATHCIVRAYLCAMEFHELGFTLTLGFTLAQLQPAAPSWAEIWRAGGVETTFGQPSEAGLGPLNFFEQGPCPLFEKIANTFPVHEPRNEGEILENFFCWPGSNNASFPLGICQEPYDESSQGGVSYLCTLLFSVPQGWMSTARYF